MSRSITLHEGLRRVAAGHHLDRREAQHLFERVLDGEADAAVLGGFLAALAQRGERPEEVAGVAAALRARMTPFVHGAVDAVDTCGTGGDGLGMINVSTAAAFVAAAAGARVVKHGNRSVSSRSGSADVLEALGGEVDVDADVALEALERTGFTFLFAPRYHPAMRHAAPSAGPWGSGRCSPARARAPIRAGAAARWSELRPLTCRTWSPAPSASSGRRRPSSSTGTVAPTSSPSRVPIEWPRWGSSRRGASTPWSSA